MYLEKLDACYRLPKNFVDISIKYQLNVDFISINLFEFIIINV